MKNSGLNFRHLYFFWMVAKEGGVTRAAEKLGLAVQTISMQLASLEQSIGKQLLEPQGRRLVPTEAGRWRSIIATRFSRSATSCRTRWKKPTPARCASRSASPTRCPS
jgi:DNA-binding transcriptional LysR family regulator